MPGSRRTIDSPRGSRNARASTPRTAPYSFRSSFELVQDLIDAVGREVLVIDMIHHHHGRVVARGEALFLALEVNAAVRSALPRLDAELFLAARDDLVRAAQHAGDVGAYRYVMPAHGLGREHGVKGRDLVHVNRWQRQ